MDPRSGTLVEWPGSGPQLYSRGSDACFNLLLLQCLRHGLQHIEWFVVRTAGHPRQGRWVIEQGRHLQHL